MEITTKNLYLVELKQDHTRESKKKECTVRLSVKHNTITFSAQTVKTLNMKDGWVKWYISSQKNVIAWKVKSSLSQEDILTKDWKFYSVNKDSGVIIAGGKQLFKQVDVAFMEKLPAKSASFVVKKYKEAGIISEEYYYIEINKNSAAYKDKVV